ncbi:HPC2 multi-domain protein [Streptomyces sp. NPDC056909]|uniref:HPC2 multi-domain protein n=1 Tax=Streptomyces sp. NPDC056909 TaxID=3345963 RepID=UPI0036B0AFDA
MKATPDKSSAVAARTAATRQTDVARADVSRSVVSRADVPYADVSRADMAHAAVSHVDVPRVDVPDSLSDTGTTAPAVSPTGPGLDVRSVRRLQAGAGNAAVARLVAQRYAEVVKPPPSQAPGFRRVRSDVAAKQTKLKRHRPAAVESRSAQDAALAPPDDRQAQGKAANAEKMNEAKPGEFDKGAFIGAVNEAIAAQAPKNLEEADGFADSGRADSIKDSVDGKVKDGKESSAEEIETATTAAPDTSRAKEKQVTPMSPDQPPGNPGAPSAADAVPARQPDEVLDFSEGPRQVDQQMADAEVTEEQLARGNEPQFDRALAEKKKGERQTAAVPAKGRAAEAEQLSAAKAGAAASGAQAMNAMTADRGAAGRAVDSGKGETKSADEKKREQVTARLQKVFDATQKDVEKILGDLDGKVDRQFTEGEKRARDDFTADHKRRMKEYKDRRYSGWRGPFRWGRDKLKGLPQEGLDIFKKSRELYVTKMRAVISTIADTIGTELGRAKARIATGRDELKAEVDRLPADLRQFGEEAAADFAGKFDDLESQVDDKSQELVQTLAQKYTEALNSVDEEIKKLEEENKGLIAMVVDAVVGVIQTIMELKNLLMGILAKAASAITKIIKDPIGFLRNLVSSVGAGLNLFIGNIADHLKTGLVSWLLGTAVSTGLAIPSRFDLKGIIQLIASLLGLTWDNIRARITRKGVPEQAMAKVEQSVPVAGALAREGPAGAAQEITAETGDLKTTILDDLKSYLIPTVLIAGITWILSLLNPASAFVRAVKAIIDIVTFIVTQGAQIAAFVNAVLDAVIAIANGAQAGVPKAIETALATSIPLLIGLLASLLGIGGLANKVRQAFQKVSRPVNRAIDKLVDKITKVGKRVWNGIRRRESDRQKLTGNFGEKRSSANDGNSANRTGGGRDAKQRRLERVVTSLKPRIFKALENGVSPSKLRIKLALWKARYRLSSLSLESGGDFVATINPSITLDDPKGRKISDAELADLLLPIFREVEERFEREPAGTLLPDGSIQLRLPLAVEAERRFAAGTANALDLGLTRSQQRAILARVRQATSQQEVEPGVFLYLPSNSLRSWRPAPDGVRRIGKVQAPWNPQLNSPKKRERREPGKYKDQMMAALVLRGVTEFGLAAADIDHALAVGSRAATASLKQKMTSGSNQDRIEYIDLIHMHNLLRHAVEAGRYPGMGTVTAVTSALVATGVATHDQVVSGNMAPMAPVGASFTAKKPKRRRDHQEQLVPLGSNYPYEHQLADRIRMRRIGTIVRQLLEETKAKAVIATPTGYRLDALARAIRQWLATRLDQGRDPLDKVLASRQLRQELMELMSHYDGQT